MIFQEIMEELLKEFELPDDIINKFTGKWEINNYKKTSVPTKARLK